jgi:hypothetical protein
MNSNRFLHLTLCLLVYTSPAAADEISVSGTEQTECAVLDDWMKSLLAEHSIPGGSLAVMRDGKLVYARGFGWADREAKTPVQPDSLFRIASVSKPITAVAILKLADRISKPTRNSTKGGGRLRSRTACRTPAAGIATNPMTRCFRRFA